MGALFLLPSDPGPPGPALRDSQENLELRLLRPRAQTDLGSNPSSFYATWVTWDEIPQFPHQKKERQQ